MSPAPAVSATAVRSEMNVTPLVDVCLVLLIVVMVLVPIIQAGVAVDLPKSAKGPALAVDATQLTVTIQKDGSVSVGDARVADSDLGPFLAAIQAAEPGKEVLVRGDQSLLYGKVAEVLAVLRDAGYSRMGLVLERKPAAD